MMINCSTEYELNMGYILLIEYNLGLRCWSASGFLFDNKSNIKGNYTLEHPESNIDALLLNSNALLALVPDYVSNQQINAETLSQIEKDFEFKRCSNLFYCTKTKRGVS